jgi:hypothetical protein
MSGKRNWYYGGMWAMWGKIVRIKKNQEFEELKTNNNK